MRQRPTFNHIELRFGAATWLAAPSSHDTWPMLKDTRLGELLLLDGSSWSVF
jgi:hypothetical protein